MLKKNKAQLVLSSAVILLPVLAGLILWNVLPERFATHWSAAGEVDGWSSKTFAVFVMPIIMLAIHWLCVWVTMKDPKNKDQSGKVFGMVLWMMPMTSLIMNGMVYSIALGNDISVDVFVRILLGLMFVILGNYMPKCRQNYTIGIKVSWALKNEENWNRTHRFAGRLWVGGGLLLLATLFVEMKSFIALFLPFILVLSFAPMLYSYLYYRKQLKAGTATGQDKDTDTNPFGKKYTVTSLVIGAVSLILVFALLAIGKYEVQFDGEMLVIDATFWEDATVNYTDIDSVEYRQTDEPGSRTFGYGTPSLLMGEFENSEFGSYTRYSYTSCDSCIVLTVEGEVLVINGKDEGRTREIYEELNARVTGK